jgi:kinesin family protein 3/17
MIAAVSPADYNYLETVSTLKYANRAKSIENAVSRNEYSSERMIRDLQKQIEELKAQLQGNVST